MALSLTADLTPHISLCLRTIRLSFATHCRWISSLGLNWDLTLAALILIGMKSKSGPQLWDVFLKWDITESITINFSIWAWGKWHRQLTAFFTCRWLYCVLAVSQWEWEKGTRKGGWGTRLFPLRPLTNPSHKITHALNWRSDFLDHFSELRSPGGDLPTQPENSQGLQIYPQRLSGLGTYYPSKYNKFSISQDKINSV